jgi:hypothetical protein
MDGQLNAGTQAADNSAAGSQVSQIGQIGTGNGEAQSQSVQQPVQPEPAQQAQQLQQQPQTEGNRNALLDFLQGTGSKWVTQSQEIQSKEMQGAANQVLQQGEGAPQVSQAQGQQASQQAPQASQTQQVQQGQQATPDQQPQVNESQPETPVPDKFKNPDGTVNVSALLKSYGSLEQKLGEQGNQLGQVQALQKKVEELTGLIQSQQQAAQQQNQAASLQKEPPQLTEDQISQMNEQFLQDYYENPIQTMNTLVSAITKNAIQSALQPLVSQIQPVVQAHEQSVQMQKWNQQTEEVAKANPQEFEALKPLMSQVINEQADIISALPENLNKVQYVFNQAKAIKAQQTAAELAAQAAQIKTPEQMLADPEFVQKILQNDQIKQMFAQSQAQAIRQGQPPVVIGNQPAGASPAAPAPDVKNIKDATPSALNYFKKVMTGGF